jgi:hypothetical protein
MNRIALAIGYDGKLAEFFSIIEVLIYEKQKEWSIVDRFNVTQESNSITPITVRNKAVDISNLLLQRKCNNIVGREITGIPYHSLCRAGLEVFEADEISDQLFDEIYKDYLAEREIPEEKIEMIPPRPVPVDDEGNYYLDFIKAIKCHPELSSKKMLMPFLSNDLFYSLIIRCEHLMSWIEDFIKINGLIMEAKRENGIYHVMITHGSCHE